jgi:uncharacterized Zn finger protein
VPVAKRRAQAASYAARLAKREKRSLAPVAIAGRQIATSYWGRAWCDNLESYSDFENRLPRGRTYVRNGSVIDLQIARGEVQAIVSGSEIYRVRIKIKTLNRANWSQIKQDCGSSIPSLIDLVQGRFDQSIMERLARPRDGLFPSPNEIQMQCSCPDWAVMCKHAAAVLYGIGARLDHCPELLFALRAVDHLELISEAVDAKNLERSLASGSGSELEGSDLGAIFGIELETADAAPSKASPRRHNRAEIHPTRPPTAEAAKKRKRQAAAESAVSPRPFNVKRTRRSVK